MSRQIVKKPNGKYAIWSSIVDDFVYDDVTKEEYIKIKTGEESDAVRKRLTAKFEKVDRMTDDEAKQELENLRDIRNKH